MRNIEKKRNKFLNKLEIVSSFINTTVFRGKFQSEVYFSGRDEDFIVFLFKNEECFHEIRVELQSHQYELRGDEIFSYTVYNAENRTILSEMSFKCEPDSITDFSSGRELLSAFISQVVKNFKLV